MGKRKIFNNTGKVSLRLLFLTLLSLSAGINEAKACCRCLNDVILGVDFPQWFTGADATVNVVNNHLDAEFNALETWMISVLFEDNILPAMMLMTEQLTVVAMSQVQIFGSFLDAKHQLETQRLLQRLQAEAHKDYHPSVGMCEFGTAVRSLAASERKGEIASITLAQRSIGRQLGSPNTSAVYGMDWIRKGAWHNLGASIVIRVTIITGYGKCAGVYRQCSVPVVNPFWCAAVIIKISIMREQ